MEEYETHEMFEMAYLFYLGFPHEFDRTNPDRVKMIFKGDTALIKGKLKDFWDCNTKVDARGQLNAFKEIKKSLWVGGTYNPHHYKRPETDVIRQINENDEIKNTRPADKQKE